MFSRRPHRRDYWRVAQPERRQSRRVGGRYLLTEMLTRLAGTQETERDADDRHRDEEQFKRDAIRR
jgi:hypothetical protein